MENFPKDGPLRPGPCGAVVVGVSAGGLTALESILECLPTDFSPALVIVQHLHPRQCDFLVKHLNDLCRLPVKEAEEKESIRSGGVYLAPANYHLLVEADRTFSLSTDEKVNYSRPSIDVLFETAVEAYGAELVGIVLTGTSCDGAAGLRRIKEAAGLTIVEDPATAEFPAMPKAALEETQADHVLSIDGIGKLLCKLGRPVSSQTAEAGSEDHG